MNIPRVQYPNGEPVCWVQCEGLYYVFESSQTTCKGIPGPREHLPSTTLWTLLIIPTPGYQCQRSTIQQLTGPNCVTYFIWVIMCSFYTPKYCSIQPIHTLDSSNAFPQYIPIQGYYRGAIPSSSPILPLLCTPITLVAPPHMYWSMPRYLELERH